MVFIRIPGRRETLHPRPRAAKGAQGGTPVPAPLPRTHWKPLPRGPGIAPSVALGDRAPRRRTFRPHTEWPAPSGRADSGGGARGPLESRRHHAGAAGTPPLHERRRVDRRQHAAMSAGRAISGQRQGLIRRPGDDHAFRIVVEARATAATGPARARTDRDSAVEGTARLGQHGIATEGNSWYLVRERRSELPRTSRASARSRTTARMKEAGMAGRPPARAGPHRVTARTAAAGGFGTFGGKTLPPFPPQECGTRVDATGYVTGRPDPAARRRA